MAFKHSILIALIAIPTLPNLGSIAFAEGHSDAKTWASPNVAGMPGYKEPPKVDEVRAPIPVKDDPRYGSRYQVQRTEGGSDANR